MSLKNKALFDGWISIAVKAYRHDKIMREKKLSGKLEDWIYREWRIKKQTIYNYRNLYKLISVTPNYYFKENDELIPWKHEFYCACEKLYFLLFRE